MNENESTCPVCKSVLNEVGRLTTGDWKQFDCANCGRYELTGTDMQMVKNGVSESPDFGPCLAHKIRRMQRNKEWPRVPSDLIDRMRKDERERRLPDPAEQADNLVLWVGETQRFPGRGVLNQSNFRNVTAVIGAFNGGGAKFIADALRAKGLVQCDVTSVPDGWITLTFEGWERYHQLKRQSTSGPRAFMAMQYNDPILDEKVFPKFKSEAEAAGFELVKLTEVSRAGSIDEQLRVEIRRARFLVADLTHDNSGAYWEAGFAEGLGKPVIYTCEKSIFESRGTHFDTSHSHTILWDADDPVKAARDLKATIRATLPDEARMDD